MHKIRNYLSSHTNLPSSGSPAFKLFEIPELKLRLFPENLY